MQRESKKMSSSKGSKLSCGLAVRLEAKPGKEEEVAALLMAGLEMVYQEDINPLWIAVRLGPTTFGIFDAFPSETQRQAHLEGPIAQAVISAADLLAKPLSIEPFEVLGGKITQEVADIALPKAA
jgi:quinol monooxygenase YgiN